MSQRIPRVNQLIKQEVAKLFLEEMYFGKNVLVTITSVSCSPDLKSAKIELSVMPDNRAKEVLKKINKRIFFLQQALNKKLNMYFVPRICFSIDKGEQKRKRIEELLNKIR